ncbi:MAG: hybrid sensor histidine kinase/response regulator [Isosphaeraceae bacterium]
MSLPAAHNDSLAWLEAVLAAVGDAVIGADGSGRVKFFNPAAESLTRWPRDEAIGRPLDEVLVVLDERTGRPLGRSPSEKIDNEQETPRVLVARDGTERPVEERTASFPKVGGSPHGLVLVFRDVTERLRAEEAIRALTRDMQRRVAEFQALLEVIPIGIAIADDPECRRIWCNPALYELLRLPPESNASLSAPAGEHPDFRVFENGRELEPRELPMQVAVATGSEVRGVRQDVLLRDGSWITMLNYAVPLYDESGRIRGGLCASVDVTAHEQTRQALRDSEQRWRTMAEALPNLVWTDLPDGQCDWLSSQWGKYTGIPEQELLGLRWLETVVHPDDRERTMACWVAACADEADYDLEYRIRRHDGQYRWFRTRGVPIRDDGGRIVYWFGTCTDIEDYKRAEAALQETDRRKDEFLATLAHELRNPLAPIRNALNILRMPSVDSRTVGHSLAMMERQVHHLVRLVDDLLDVSRVMRGKITLHPERVELARTIAHAVETAEPMVAAQGHELAVTMPDPSLTIDADPVRLAQVVGNLLANAAKYSERGGRIELDARREGDRAIIRVRDTGVGIAPEVLPRIFDLFVQGDHSSTRSQGGLGIGLTLVRNLVELHGGTVEARSDGPGRGAEFIVRLPAEPGDRAGLAGPRAGRAGRREASRASHRILVVDDNRDAADSLALWLRMQGHKVEVAHDGPSALEAAASFRPRLVLLDLGMSGMDGFEVARRLRGRPDADGVRLAALTGWGGHEYRRRTLEAGFDHHLVKPVEPRKLDDLLESLAHPDV